MPANTTGSRSPKSGKKKGRRARLHRDRRWCWLLVAGIGYGAYWGVSTVRASFPQTTGSLKLKGLSGPVDVKRDGYGIPQIYADTDEDLFRAQGYVQAQDRFWEMDVRRHMTAGRLSEMFGKGQVETDAFLRTLGWRQVAQEEYDTKLSPQHEEVPPGLLRRASTPTSRATSGTDLSLEYAALGLQQRLQARRSGPRSTRWPGSRRWPGTCAATCRTRSTAP